jgi:hypothetical protein
MLETVNSLLNYPNTKVVLVLLFSIMAGYTLNPVPEMMKNLFHNSHLFKFFVLFMLALLTTNGQVTTHRMLLCGVSVIVVLLIFHLIRNYEVSLNVSSTKKHD